MPRLIPAIDAAFWTQLVDLDNTTFTLTYRYNTRETAWYFDIGEQNGTVIVGGLKLVPNMNLTGRFADSRLPLGELITQSVFPNERPGRDSLSNLEFQIWYLTRTELES